MWSTSSTSNVECEARQNYLENEVPMLCARTSYIQKKNRFGSNLSLSLC